VNSQKISHAQLFLGKMGHGGLPLALAFSQYIFCENKTESDSCGACDGCRKVGNLQHPDLHFSFPVVQAISKTSDSFLTEWREQISENPYFNLENWINKTDSKGRKPIIGTQQSEEIIKKLGLRSYEGGYKIMIIWMAEEMNGSCANKLLKILEEPPQKTIFLLLVESQEQMLQTIISRTQILTIPRINLDEMSNYLMTKFQVAKNVAESISSRSDGNLNEATEILEGVESVEENRELFIRLMRVCYKKNVIDMMNWSEDVAKSSRSSQKTFLKYALHMFRQSMLRNYTEDHLTRVSEDEDAFLEKFAKFISGNNVFDFMKTFNDAHYHIERNANPKILFMNLCFQVMRYIHVA
jgi:DNA polymerase-3 subunit delta'